MFWVETARLAGKDSAVVIVAAQKLAGYAGTPRADADKESLLRNLAILERLGCLDEAGMAALRTGGAPKIKKGPYMGDTVAVDHIIPIAVVPELENRLFNLEFMPTRLNQEKGAKVGVRQRQLADKWLKLGLLSRQGGEKVHGSS